jgi:hypothetical protein
MAFLFVETMQELSEVIETATNKVSFGGTECSQLTVGTTGALLFRRLFCPQFPKRTFLSLAEGLMESKRARRRRHVPMQGEVAHSEPVVCPQFL